jgi:hypothetical protein
LPMQGDKEGEGERGRGGGERDRGGGLQRYSSSTGLPRRRVLTCFAFP